jgi:hypothetical protein
MAKILAAILMFVTACSGHKPADRKEAMHAGLENTFEADMARRDQRIATEQKQELATWIAETADKLDCKLVCKHLVQEPRDEQMLRLLRFTYLNRSELHPVLVDDYARYKRSVAELGDLVQNRAAKPDVIASCKQMGAQLAALGE